MQRITSAFARADIFDCRRSCVVGDDLILDDLVAGGVVKEGAV